MNNKTNDINHKDTFSKKVSKSPLGDLGVYFSGIFHGLITLLTGMKVTLIEFFTKKTTEEYPDNRDTLVMFDRYRGTLYMPHDENGNNKCIACGLCQSACPNNTLNLEIDTITDEETGKKKKVLVKYQYDLGSCMFCQLCTNICPTDAIEFSSRFEHAVYNKDVLVKILNKPTPKSPKGDFGKILSEGI